MNPEMVTVSVLAELARLRARHTNHYIGREITQQGNSAQRVRYVAYAVIPGVKPHTVITDDIDELRAALESADSPREP